MPSLHIFTECTETTENPFKFTGQYFDSEIEEYYLRAHNAPDEGDSQLFFDA